MEASKEKLWLLDEKTGLVDLEHPLCGAGDCNLAWEFEEGDHCARLTQVFLLGKDGHTYSIKASPDGKGLRFSEASE